MTDLQKTERKKMILAMEFICRQIDDEDILEGWLMFGVPDGDIDYGEWDISKVDDSYIEDDTFREFMDCFLRRMSGAKKYGGLFCGGIVTNEGSEE